MATITSHYARAALQGVKRLGQDTSPLLEAAGISPELLNSPERRIHADQITRLVQAIWNSLQDEFMGFTKTRCKQGAFAMMCELVSHADTVDIALTQGIKFYQFISDEIQMEYRHETGHRELVVNMMYPELDPEHFYLEFWLVIWHRFISWMSGKKIKIQAIYFAYPKPNHFSEFKYQFACPCFFDAPETKLCFSQQYANLPMVRTQRELAQFLKNSPADLMTIPGDDDSLSLMIKITLLEKIKNKEPFPEFESIAKGMNLSPQTLRRRLHDEGINYQKIKDAIRCDLAIEQLTVHNMPVNDVANLLGFSEARSFTRAFKIWTGVSPSVYSKK